MGKGHGSFQDLFATVEGDDDDDDGTANTSVNTSKDFMSSVIGKLARDLSDPSAPAEGSAAGRGVSISQDYVNAVEDWRLVTTLSSGERDGSSLLLASGGHHRCLLVPANQALVLRDILVKMRAVEAAPADTALTQSQSQDLVSVPGSPQSLASGWSRGL